MVRKARTPSKTGYYHVMVQGNNKEHVFKNDIDKEFYLLYLKDCMINNNVELAAWCILNNNAHFVFKASIERLSKLMRETNTKYAVLYNKKYDRVGHVFRGRFKCENIEQEDFLLGVIRYVHNRPSEKNIVGKAYKYSWSSYKEYLTTSKYTDKEQIDIILSYFDSDIKRFKQFHKIDDFNKYLDIIELNSKDQIRKAEKVIDNFCKKHRVSEIINIHGEPVLMQELVSEILLTSKLSNRKIASLIGISSYYIKKVQDLMHIL